MKKKRIIAVLLAGFICMQLSACAQNNNEATHEKNDSVETNNSVIPVSGEAVVEDNYDENIAAGRIASKGFAVFGADDTFHPYTFTRHSVGDDDILIEIKYSSICHSDIHAAESHWGESIYPMVPGHEMVGVVTQVGSNVTKFKVGDYAAMGPMANSGENGWPVWTYNSIDTAHNNEPAMGGYSNNMVVNENYAISIPKNADLEKVAPLVCAGITVYSPITFSKVKAGDTVGVAGFGGLGDMAVRFLQSIGTNITVFDVNEDKRKAAEEMGIKFVNVNDEKELEGLNNTMDFIISTIPASYNPMMYVQMLKEGGQMAVVGQPASDADASISVGNLPMAQHRYIYGSMIGTIDETTDMVKYCVENNIYPDVEIINASESELDRVFNLLENNEGDFRYVMDMSTME